MPIDVRVVRMNRAQGKYGRLKAFVDIEINNSILIKGLFVMSGKKGLFISMPRQKGTDNRWYEIVQIVNQRLKEEVFSRVLLEYEQE